MKRVTHVLATLPASWLLVAALAHAPAGVYSDTVKGIQTASIESEAVSLLLNAEGDLPGVGSVSLRRDGNKVTGGSWALTVMPPDAPATANEKGRLTGTATGGTLTFTGDGSLAGADSLQLTIQGGTGQYARVERGSATLSLSSSAENPSQLTGTLTLNF